MESCVDRLVCVFVFARLDVSRVVVVRLRRGLTSFVFVLLFVDARVRGIRRRLVGVVHRGGRSTKFGE